MLAAGWWLEGEARYGKGMTRNCYTEATLVRLEPRASRNVAPGMTVDLNDGPPGITQDKCKWD